MRALFVVEVEDLMNLMLSRTAVNDYGDPVIAVSFEDLLHRDGLVGHSDRPILDLCVVLAAERGEFLARQSSVIRAQLKGEVILLLKRGSKRCVPDALPS